MGPRKAMLLAAGAGTRLRPLTFETPKPMVPVVNRPVIHHVLDNLLKHGVEEVMVNLHAHPEQVRGYCGDGSRWSLKLRYSHEPKLMGTAGSIKKVEGFFKDGPFFVMSGDGVSDIDLTAMWSFHRRRGSFATMAIKRVDARFEYGVTMTDGSQRIKGFLEKPSWSDVFSNKVNTGIYLFEPEVLKLIPKGRPYDFGHELWPKLLKMKKPIYAYETDAYWCDVGNLPEFRRCQIDTLDRTAQVNIPGKELRKGVWVEDGVVIDPKARLEAPVLIGKGSRVAAGAVVGPYTVVGDRARIGAGALLERCILFDNVVVGDGVRLNNCIIGSDGRVKENISVYEAAVLNLRQ
ncbi:MAG: NDP-sugar synthase [Elusimicrobiota bacterium]|nr:NDP-sugar synthase [Elusimicrobiota bacterium]